MFATVAVVAGVHNPQRKMQTLRTLFPQRRNFEKNSDFVHKINMVVSFTFAADEFGERSSFPGLTLGRARIADAKLFSRNFW